MENSKKIVSSGYQKCLVVSCVLVIFLCILAAVISFIFLLSRDSINSNQNEKTTNATTQTTVTNKKDHETKTYVSNDKYPYDLPTDAPISFENIEKYVSESHERYSVQYFSSDSSTEEFKQKIEPYVDLYLASSEYTFQQYDSTFTTPSSDTDARKSLTIRVYESCSDVSSAIGEEACRDVKLLGSASPFTFNVSLFINLDHPDFKDEFLIITGMHETIHLLQYTYDKATPGNIIPVWYKESMAEALAYFPENKKSIYPELFDNFDYPETLEELDEFYKGGEGTPEDVNNMRRAYYIGQEYFNFLLERTTLDQYLALIPKKVSYMSENEFEQEFIAIFGKPSEETYKEFLAR